MINIFEYLSSEKYQVVIVNDDFEIYHIENDMINQEKFISVTNKMDQFTVRLTSRNETQEVGIFENKSHAIAVVIILCHKYFERENESNFNVNEFKHAANSFDFKKIVDLISKDCTQEYYSILNFKDDAICMVKDGDVYDVYYYNNNTKKVIVQDITLFRASIVTRNYAKLLLKFNELYIKLPHEFSLNNDLYLLFLEYYLF